MPASLQLTRGELSTGSTAHMDQKASSSSDDKQPEHVTVDVQRECSVTTSQASLIDYCDCPGSQTTSVDWTAQWHSWHAATVVQSSHAGNNTRFPWQPSVADRLKSFLMSLEFQAALQLTTGI